MHRHQWIIFLPNFILSRLYVTLYLISYCVFHFNWCRVYTYICIYMRIYLCVSVYIYIYVYVPANARNHVYMIICMFSMCAHFMYADFMNFFTYGCLVRDDLIKKFKLKLSAYQNILQIILFMNTQISFPEALLKCRPFCSSPDMPPCNHITCRILATSTETKLYWWWWNSSKMKVTDLNLVHMYHYCSEQLNRNHNSYKVWVAKLPTCDGYELHIISLQPAASANLQTSMCVTEPT